MVLSGVAYGEDVTVRITTWRPPSYFRVSLRVSHYGTAIDYMVWMARVVPAWCAANYIGIDTFFTYTAENNAEMADIGLKAWVLEQLGLEEFVPV